MTWDEIWQRTQDTGHRTQYTGHRIQDTGHRTQDTWHSTQDTGQRTQDTGHRTNNTQTTTQESKNMDNTDPTNQSGKPWFPRKSSSSCLRNNSRMPGSMLILAWVGIIFVIILHRAKASENYFDSNRAFKVILCIQAYLDRGYFGRCSNYLPLLFTRIYNATETL